jgi:hypothetical protein
MRAKALDYQSVPRKFISLKDMHPGYYNKMLSAEQKRAHDSAFGILTNKLAKVDPTIYEPIIFTTYRRDFKAIEATNEFVDGIEFYSTDYTGLANEIDNLTGSSNDIIPLVNAGISQEKVPVFLFQLTYVLKFVEIEKLSKKDLPVQIEAVYQKAASAGFELFVEKVSHLGLGVHGGLFNHEDVGTTATAIKKSAVTGSTATDAELLALINTPIKRFLDMSNFNVEMMPDTLLVPVWLINELQNRSSAMYTHSLYDYVVENNLATAAAKNYGLKDFKLSIEGRPMLDDMGVNNTGRIVAYKNDGRFVKLHIPYAFQAYMTQPDITLGGYVTLFLAQVSAPQIPYKEAVRYFDFIAE